MENSPYSIYCHNPRNPYFRLTCNRSDLLTVKILEEQYDSDNVCTRKVAIYCCRVCGGFYKQEYRAINYPTGLFDVDAGWDIQDHYYKIEEPPGDSKGCPIPLTIEDARAFGYTGEDFTWKDNRCNFNLQKVELTCRLRDLQFMGWLSPALRAHNNERFYKCIRCGEWYLFKILPVYIEAYLKPASEHFPIEIARAYGFDESKS